VTATVRVKKAAAEANLSLALDRRIAPRDRPRG
jgi:hypothetical protein